MFTRWPVHSRVLANLIDGSAMDGLLLSKRGELLHLSDCVFYSPGTEPAEVDGDVYIERHRILYLQKPRGGG